MRTDGNLEVNKSWDETCWTSDTALYVAETGDTKHNLYGDWNLIVYYEYLEVQISDSSGQFIDSL